MASMSRPFAPSSYQKPGGARSRAGKRRAAARSRIAASAANSGQGPFRITPPGPSRPLRVGAEGCAADDPGFGQRADGGVRQPEEVAQDVVIVFAEQRGRSADGLASAVDV